ncbi:hypothetical protein [Candidatus Alkanophaga liquidiphilum]
MLFQGYIVERISEDGRLEVFVHMFGSNLLHILETKLPIILEIPKRERRGKGLNKEFLGPYALAARLGRCRYRYLARRVVPSGFAFVVLLPRDYDYTNYEVRLPKDTTHHKKIRKLPASFEYVIADRFEDRLHIGPNFSLLYNHWTQCHTKAVCYANPNRKAVTLTLSMDITPMEEVKRAGEHEISISVMEPVSDRDPFQNVVDRAYGDQMDRDIGREVESVKSISELDKLLKFIIKDTKTLLGALKRMGIEVMAGGKHQYKARNPKTGKSAPISWRREFRLSDIKKICRELGINYDEFRRILKLP